MYWFEKRDETGELKETPRVESVSRVEQTVDPHVTTVNGNNGKWLRILVNYHL